MNNIKWVRIGKVIWSVEGPSGYSSINAAKRMTKQGAQDVRAFLTSNRAEGLRLVRELGWT